MRASPFGDANQAKKTRRFDMRQRLTGLVLLSAGIVVAALATSSSALEAPAQFKGLINDYTPENTVSPTGPWEVRGAWQLNVHWDLGTANFSAELTMERSDYSIVCCGIDPDSPAERTPHTHTISLVGGRVTKLTGGGFEVTGPVAITANRSPKFTGSTLTIQITGGTKVTYSNIKLTFSSPASGHFGTEAVNGVVQVCY
jgi:hypothetical protein